MCHARIVKGVKRKMLPRRRLFIVGAPARSWGTGGPARVMALV